MTRLKLFLIVMIGVTFAMMTNSFRAQAHDITSGSLTIEHPWSRPTIGNAPNSAAYLKITNHGGTPDTLMGVKSDVAKRVELHMVKMDDGVMRMRAAKDGVTVPANGSVELKPGGVHIMLMGLSRKLTPGQMFDLTLQFKHQGAVPIQVKVEKMGAMGGSAMKDGAMKDGSMKSGHKHSGHGQ